MTTADSAKETFRRAVHRALATTPIDAAELRAIDSLVEDGWREIERGGGDAAIGETMLASWQSEVGAQSGAARTKAIELVLVDRRLTRVRAAAYQLGRATIDRARPKAELVAEVAPIRAELDALRAAIESVAEPSTRQRLERERREALLDLDYVEDEKVLSHRLGQYQGSRP